MSDNLIVLSSGEAAAVEEFSRVLAEPVLVFVVLGDGQKEREAAPRADQMAGGTNDPCKIVWAKQPTHVQGKLGELENPDGLDVSGRAAVACSLSLAAGGSSREIRDVVAAAEDPGFFRILLSLAKAMR